MSDGAASKGEPRSLGIMRAFGWMAAAFWWCLKSPSGGRVLVIAGLPWALLSLLKLPTGGLSMMAAVAFYPQLCLWSVLWAREHFLERETPLSEVKNTWLMRVSDSRGLPLAFMAVAFLALGWVTLCVQFSAVGTLLESMREAKDSEAAREMVARAWEQPGLDGILWPIIAIQMGLAVLNGFWLCLPWASLCKPGQGAIPLLKSALTRFRLAPGALFVLGLVGALSAQAGLAFAPFGLFAGVWFVACAFAARDLGDFPE